MKKMSLLIWLLFSSFQNTLSQVCTTGTDYAIEVIFALDTTGTDGTAIGTTEWASQLAFANAIVQRMRASTSVGVVRLSETISSAVSKSASNPTLSLAYSATPTGNTDNKRIPSKSIPGIIQHGFTSGFATQKYLIISAYGEIESGEYCLYKTLLKQQNIEVIVIGSGDDFSPEFTADATNGFAKMQYLCLTENPQVTEPGSNGGFIARPIPSSIDSTIAAVLSSSFLCPSADTYKFKITEIRPQGSNKFVEIVNLGRQFTTAQITVKNTNFLTYSSSITQNIAQGAALVISGSAITQCSGICTAYASVVTDTTGSFSNQKNNWQITVEVGSALNAITIQHRSGSGNQYRWWITPDGFTYELYAIGSNDQWPNNWVSSRSSVGTPGGYANTAVRPDYSGNQQGGIDACHASVSASVTTGANYYLSAKTCNCEGINVGYPLYASPYDPQICKRVPEFIDAATNKDFGCRIFAVGSGTGEKFKVGYASPNTDMPFRMIYNYPSGALGTRINGVTSSKTGVVIPSSINVGTGYTTTTDKSSSNTDPIKIAVRSWSCSEDSFNKNTAFCSTDDVPAIIDSSFIMCKFYTMTPTKTPSQAPTGKPSGKPSATPTGKPTNGVPFIYADRVICDEVRCGCGATGPCDPDEYKTLTTTRPVVTNRDDLKPFSIDIVDGLGIQGDFTDTVCFVWNMTFLQICSLPMWNATSKSCKDPIRTTSDLGKKVIPPILSNNTDLNFTFTSDIEITPTGEEVCITGDERIGTVIFKEFKLNTLNDEKRPYKLIGQYVAQYLFKITDCYQKTGNVIGGACIIEYPNEYYFFYEIGQQPGRTTRNEDEIPTWIWWIIIPLLIILAIIAILVYKNWWKKKKADEELGNKKKELNEMVEENEMGFGRDLDTTNINTNPMAKANPAMTGPAPSQRVDPNLGNNERIQDVARVKGEKFEIRQEYGQSRQAQRVTSYDYE